MSLISTGAVRTWLKLAAADTGPNDKIASLINAVEDFCDSYTNRKLEAVVYSSDLENCHYDGPGGYWLYTKQYPISSIQNIRIDSDRDFGDSTVLVSDDYYFYPSGKLISEGGYFTRGHRNVRIDYTAGFAPVLGGTHNNAISTYPCPYDLQQVIIEMVAKSMKEGITMIHTVQSEEAPTFQQMLTAKSFWRTTLNKYKNYAIGLEGYDE